MVDKDYERAREVAAKELEKLLAVQQQTEQRILHLRNTIAALDQLSDLYHPKTPVETPRLMESRSLGLQGRRPKRKIYCA